MSVLGCFSSVSAQPPKVEVSGGYQVLRALDKTFPAGWYVDVAADLNPWFGIVGEVGGAYKSESRRISINRTADVTSKLHTFMAGVRLSARINPRIVLFHNVLVGAVHASVGTDAVGVSLSPAETKVALQPNIGVNLMITDKVGVRAAADYRRVFLGNDRGGENEFRVAVGVVLPFGK